MLGAFGDAGAVVTDDEDFANKVRLLRNHGRTADDIEGWSFNCRIDNLHAAILDLKLKKLPGWLQRRREIASLYGALLGDIPQLRLPLPPATDADRHDVFQNYEIEAEDRDGLLRHLRANGVEILLPWGGKGVHQFSKLGLSDFQLPRTDELFRKALFLPLYAELRDDEVRYVSEVVQRYFETAPVTTATMSESSAP